MCVIWFDDVCRQEGLFLLYLPTHVLVLFSCLTASRIIQYPEKSYQVTMMLSLYHQHLGVMSL